MKVTAEKEPRLDAKAQDEFSPCHIGQLRTAMGTAALPSENEDEDQHSTLETAANSTDQARQLKTLQMAANRSGQVAQHRSLQAAANHSRSVAQYRSFQAAANESLPVQQSRALQSQTNGASQNKTGMPDALKQGIESLSGISLDDARVHYNSEKPAQLLAHAYAQGSEIHVAPGQEQHLPHEAWHVVQQKQGRVKPTLQMKGIAVNDDQGLEREADAMGDKALAGNNLAASPLRVQPSPPTVVQGYFTHFNHLLQKNEITIIAAWLKKNGEDDASFLAKANDKFTNDGTLSSYLKDNDIKATVKSILCEGEELDDEFGFYDSDDEADMSDGEDQVLYRANTQSSLTVKKHSLHSTSEQARVSIREMRKNQPLTNPNPTIAKMGDQHFEFTPTLARKDFGVTPMQESDKKGVLKRAGNPRTYAVLGKDLDASAKRCGLSMASMNDAGWTLLFQNPDADLKDLGCTGMDLKCLRDLRELVAILALDIARSHNAREVIELEFFASTGSFTSRLGGIKPKYGGAKNKKEHGEGGVEYLKNYDQ